MNATMLLTSMYSITEPLVLLIETSNGYLEWELLKEKLESAVVGSPIVSEGAAASSTRLTLSNPDRMEMKQITNGGHICNPSSPSA